MGDYVWIGENTEVQAFKIGNSVSIGKNCKIKERVIISDNVLILDDTTVESDTIIPSFTVYGGSPATFQGLLVESFPMIMKQKNDTYYNKFIGVDLKKRKGYSESGNKSARIEGSSVKETDQHHLESTQKPMTAREGTLIYSNASLDEKK